MRRLGRWWRNDVAAVPWTALFVTLAALVLGGWVADAWNGSEVLKWVPWLGQRQRILKWVLSAVLVFLAWRVYLKRRELTSVGALSQADAEPRRALILPLSPCGAEITGTTGELHVVRKGSPSLPDGASVTLRAEPDALADDIERLDALRQWPWQQLLRAIAPHRDTLTHLYLLGSSDSASGRLGTRHDVEAAGAFLLHYLPHCTSSRIHASPRGGVDFDDLKAMMAAMQEAIRDLKAQLVPGTGRHLREEDIMIDVTGGYKPTSIAGALMTLTSNVTFQYVHTDGGNRVREYDLLHRGPPEG